MLDCEKPVSRRGPFFIIGSGLPVVLHEESNVGLAITGAEAERDSGVERYAETCRDIYNTS